MEYFMDLEKYLYEKVLPVIQQWNDKDIYAISFYVNYNELNEYNGCSNFPEFSIGYNTEDGCSHASKLSEERWNFAFWEQDMIPIILPENSGNPANEGAKVLFDWYAENGIANIGFEDEDAMFDDEMNYIGKGPVGYYELLCVVSNVAGKLQSEGKISAQFGKIPIIVHDLEYPWYVKEATENANPNGEADTFLQALKDGFPE